MLYAITAAQLRAARALLGLDQRTLAERTGLSSPTIQRMEASDGTIRGNIDSLTRLISAFDAAGVEFLGEGSLAAGVGHGVRLKARAASPGTAAPAQSSPVRR
jgi:transcriptional regulator with XRE-family HTH domain